MSPKFVADSFTVSFGNKQVLASASAWAGASEITVILGGNGSGKTTLIRAALGLCGADLGHVVFDGQQYLKPRLFDLAVRGLYYLPDRGALARSMRCSTQVSLLRRRFGLGTFQGIAEGLGVGSLVDRYPSQLSGGERARIEIAMAVAREAECLVADEPLVGVSPKDRPHVLKLLRRVASSGAAVIVTGHDTLELLEIADSVIWMTGGTTHALGPPEAARAHAQFRREYLGPRG